MMRATKKVWLPSLRVCTTSTSRTRKANAGTGIANEADGLVENGSPSHSIAKSQRLLGYQPRYSSLEAVQEAVSWLVANKRITI